MATTTTPKRPWSVEGQRDSTSDWREEEVELELQEEEEEEEFITISDSDSGDTLSMNLTDNPTVSPVSSPRSCATRSASVIADILRGSVTPIRPFACHPCSNKY
ncbi:hypothetical protein DMENIID0001_059410 [Sergentomyia squamirostris]